MVNMGLIGKASGQKMGVMNRGRWVVLAAAFVAVTVRAATPDLRISEPVVLWEGPGNTAGVALHVNGPGDLDIAWAASNREHGSLTHHLHWVKGMVVRPDDVAIYQSHLMTNRIYGIGRFADRVTIGINQEKRIVELTLDANGTWASSATGISAAQYYGQMGAYVVSPKDGMAGFIETTADGETLLILKPAKEPPADKTKVRLVPSEPWEKQVVADGQGTRTRAALCFTPDGQPALAYQILNPDRSINSTVRAGCAGSVGKATVSAHVNFPLDIKADGKGVLHLVVALHVGATNYYRSTDCGASWARPVMILNNANYGDPARLRLAVNRGGDKLAVVFLSRHGYRLGFSTDGGMTWKLEPVDTEIGLETNLAFDSEDTLYILRNTGQGLQMQIAAPVKAD